MEFIEHPVWCKYQKDVDGMYGCYSHRYLKTSPKFCENCDLFNKSFTEKELPVYIQLPIFSEAAK